MSDTDTAPPPPAPQLKRSLSPALTTRYGLGTIPGAGISVMKPGELAAGYSRPRSAASDRGSG